MAVAFGNVSGTDYNAANVSSTANATVTKPTADVNGVLMLIAQAINDQTAGAFTVSPGTGLVVATGPTNAPSLFQSGTQYRPGLTADAATIDCNNTNGASAQKSGLVMIFTGHNVASPIRTVGTTATGTSTAPQCPNTSAATAGDMIVRIITWHDDGDGSAVTRPGGGYTPGPLFQPAAANGKAFAMDFLVSAGGTPGTATYGIAASRAWTADTIVIALAGAGSTAFRGSLLLGVGA